VNSSMSYPPRGLKLEKSIDDDAAAAQLKSFPKISSVFDQDSPHSLLYSGSVHNTLMRLLPPDFFFSEGASEDLAIEFARLLPMFKWVQWGEQKRNVSIFLLCRHRINGVKFFYEMISRWLMPGKRPNISSFFATDFKLPDHSNETFTICEVVVSLENPVDQELIRHQLPILESEIRLGLISVYHASRILEVKGLSADEKTSIIQERIVSLLERRPRDFDHDIFTQMQHFLIMCSEEFKAIREHTHMSRIIYVFYLFRKALKSRMETHPGQRFIHVKLSQTYLHLPFGLKKVLGIFAALNFQGDNELFEERHFIRVLKSHFPQLTMIEDSFFSRSSKEERTQLLYLEVEKEDGSDFTLAEIKGIKQRLPDEIRNGIEKLTRPLFMPRNEEEVMRNIITLSNQLKFSRDLPQVVIAFDEQTEGELAFTVIWLRVLKPSDPSIQELFEQSDSFLKFIPDRIKRVGLLRKKYPKEVTVFRVKFANHRFLRPDHSLDLFKARQAIVQEVQRILGEFRDYNGGMIAKQHEQFLTLRNLFSHLDRNEELLLENFFHSIFPIELRSLFNPQFLKKLFTMLLEAIKKSRETGEKGTVFQKTDQLCSYLLFSEDELSFKERVVDCVNSLQIPSSQLLTLSMRAFDSSYLGYIYLEENGHRRENFLKSCPMLQ
jgi:hypothetical protein